jgi:signal transduction histidine kinase
MNKQIFATAGRRFSRLSFKKLFVFAEDPALRARLTRSLPARIMTIFRALLTTNTQLPSFRLRRKEGNCVPLKTLFLLMACSLLLSQTTLAQKIKLDSLTRAYQKNRQDTTLVQLLLAKSGAFITTNPDSLTACTNRALALSRKIHYIDGEVMSMSLIANDLNRSGDLPGSLRMTFGLLPKAIAIKDERAVGACYNALGLDYSVLKDYKKSLSYFIMAKNVVVKARIKDFEITVYNNVAKAYLEMDKLDSAQYFTNKAYEIAVKTHDDNIDYLIRNFGIIQVLKGNYAKGIDFFRKSIGAIPKMDNHYLLSEDYRRIAEAYQKLSRADSSIYFAKKAYDEANLDKDPNMVMMSTSLLTDEYRSLNDYKDAYDYQQIMLKANDSLFSQQKTLVIQNLIFAQEQRRQQIEAAKKAYQNKVQRYALLGVLGVFVLIAVILLYANSQRKKANTVLQQRNEQIEMQHKALEKSLADLKTTQTQLIQSEKMASLGELTAGIAHEIQNPLNFVNNFSEVNAELIDELKAEIAKGNLTEIESIALDIQANEKKISQHGKRADFIVKGMLEHSRTNTGEKQLTDMNVLCDEFLKLSYHGLRAKDKNFNAEMVTHFDTRLPKVNVSQQDMGRVMLNLFNNAFYAVNQKLKTAGPDYKPEVTVSTAVENGHVVIKVTDNGVGIPDAIKEKIMQPFFTTKPTGEGTGLGLSLTYDMVVKGHGGSIKVDSLEGVGSEFKILLQVS